MLEFDDYTPDLASRGRGRPRASSAATIHEAARELFLERGYDQVSVYEIASRAGVSRGTFFAYSDGKADALWHELLPAIERACEEFDASSAPTLEALQDALVAGVESWGDTPPTVLRDAGAMGADQALRNSAATRLLPLAQRASMRLALERDTVPEAPEALIAPVTVIATAAAALVAWTISQPRGTAAAAVRAAFDREQNNDAAISRR